MGGKKRENDKERDREKFRKTESLKERKRERKREKEKRKESYLILKQFCRNKNFNEIISSVCLVRNLDYLSFYLLIYFYGCLSVYPF